MPPRSQSQRRLMWGAKNSAAVRKRTGVPLSVAEEYTEADKGGKLPEKIKRVVRGRAKRKMG